MDGELCNILMISMKGNRKMIIKKEKEKWLGFKYIIKMRCDCEWKDEQMHGKGIYKFGDGIYYYNGDWVDWVKHGWGTMKNYEGEFKNSKKTCEGVYDGQRKDDKKHGRGVLIRYEQRIVDVWENDKRIILIIPEQNQ